MGRKTKHIKLDKKKKLELELGHKNGKQNTFRQRCHYILLNAEGYGVQEIAKIYKKSRQTIEKWVKRYEQEGISGLQTASGRGRPPIIRIDNESEVKLVEDLVASNSQNLKVALAKIEVELGKKMSKDTLKRLLKKGWIWKRFRKVMPSQPDEKDYEEKKTLLFVLSLLFLGGYIDLRYGDESSFNLEPNVPYGWVKKGEVKEIPSRKGGNLNVFGLLNLAGELTSYQTTQKVDSQMVISWLNDFCSTIKKQTVVVLDNAPWHRSKAFMDKIEEWENLGLFIVFLPTYSPQLNPTEILWKKMKYEWLKPEDYLTKETLHTAIQHILKNYNNDQFCIDFNIKLNC